jgi:hypothetical protein
VILGLTTSVHSRIENSYLALYPTVRVPREKLLEVSDLAALKPAETEACLKRTSAATRASSRNK